MKTNKKTKKTKAVCIIPATLPMFPKLQVWLEPEKYKIINYWDGTKKSKKVNEMTTKIDQRKIKVKIKNKTFNVVVRQNKDTLIFSDIEKRKVGRNIIFHRTKEGYFFIGIEIINRRKYENRNENLNLYVMAKEQVEIFDKWAKE